MREALGAALATVLIAAGLTLAMTTEAEAISPETTGPDLLLVRAAVLPPVSIPLPGPPLVSVIDQTPSEVELIKATRHAPEPEPEPEPDTQVSAPAGGSENTGMGSGGVEEWRGLVTAYFGAELADTVLCLIEAESGGNPSAVNPSSGASGLLQVMPGWADEFGVSRDALFDPDTNLSISKALYDDGGFGHWSPWNRGACRG